MERNITEETVFDHKEGKDVTGNKTQMKATFVFAAPHISLDVNFENLKEKLGSHMNTDFYLKYYWYVCQFFFFFATYVLFDCNHNNNTTANIYAPIRY